MKKIITGIVCALMGLIFIFSGYTKLYPIEPFEYTLVDLGFINWQAAPFIARIMIGLEFFIGILLLLNLNLRKLAYKLAIVTLIVFSIYLTLLIAFSGNKGNCGCFGSYFHMTPLQALIKNGLMLVLFFILYRNYKGWELTQKFKLLILLPLLTSLILPFILNTIELNYSQAYLTKPENNFKLPLDSVFNRANLSAKTQGLSKGKHVIAFLSLTCPHCKIAANKLRIIHERQPDIPMYFVLNGDEKDLKSFFDDSHSEGIPHTLLLGRNFVFLAGTSLPVIYLINNSTVENEINYQELNEEELRKWLLTP